jgi:hypothetical protein
MNTDAYTAELICKSMGMPSFEYDPACTHAAEAIRVLLKPSFHPEVCVTFADGRVSVVSARFMIWRQVEPAPMLADRAEGAVSEAAFAGLISAMVPITRPNALPGIMIDGMPTEVLHFQSGAVALKAGGNGGRKGDFSAFLAMAVATAWDCISSPYCRNALAEAGEYVGKSLPRDAEPARKRTIETLVLGSDEDRAQVIEALKRHHGT